jgi:hypothetical protein
MIVVLEPITGSPKANLDRAKQEVERVLAFRGSVSEGTVKENQLIVKFEVDPKWDLPMDEKVKYLEEWIPAKVRTIFRVVGVSAADEVANEKLPAYPPTVQAYIYISELEHNLHQFVKSILVEAFGEDENGWWIKGIPPAIRVRCVTTREEDASREEPYSYTNLIDIATIITKNWNLFEPCFRPFREHVKSRNDVGSAISRVNDVRKKVFHPTSPVRMEVSEEDLLFLRKFHEFVQELTQA